MEDPRVQFNGQLDEWKKKKTTLLEAQPHEMSGTWEEECKSSQRGAMCHLEDLIQSGFRLLEN